MTYLIPDPLPWTALAGPLAAAEDAMARLDERLGQSPIREGWVSRTHFLDACASLWLQGELVHLEDLVLHDAEMDVRLATDATNRAMTVAARLARNAGTRIWDRLRGRSWACRLKAGDRLTAAGLGRPAPVQAAGVRAARGQGADDALGDLRRRNGGVPRVLRPAPPCGAIGRSSMPGRTLWGRPRRKRSI